jgi:hypothetical protein
MYKLLEGPLGSDLIVGHRGHKEPLPANGSWRSYIEYCPHGDLDGIIFAYGPQQKEEDEDE